MCYFQLLSAFQHFAVFSYFLNLILAFYANFTFYENYLLLNSANVIFLCLCVNFSFFSCFLKPIFSLVSAFLLFRKKIFQHYHSDLIFAGNTASIVLSCSLLLNFHSLFCTNIFVHLRRVEQLVFLILYNMFTFVIYMMCDNTVV